MEQIKVILADFDEAARQIMAEELAAMEDITVAGQTGMADEVLDLARTTEAQVLIMEMSLRGGDGLEVLDRVKNELGDKIRVLICSLFADRALVNGAVQRGADYYMIKPVTITALAEHIRLTALEEEGWQEDDSLQYRASMLLRRLGGIPNMKGYIYTVEAVITVLEDPDAVCGITKVVYPKIARKHRATSSAVERSIRHMLQKIWTCGDKKLLLQLFPSYTRCPSNGAFIAVLAQQLTEKQRKWG